MNTSAHLHITYQWLPTDSWFIVQKI